VNVIHVPRRLARCAWGGTEQVLEHLLERQRADGLSPQVFTSTALDAAPTDHLAGCPVQRFPYSYPVWPLPAARRAAFDRKGGNLISAALAQAVARAPRLDLVHLHTGGRLGAQVLRAARRRGVPVVLTLHGGHFDIPPAELNDLRARGHGPAWEWGRVLSWWWGSRQLLAQVDALMCVGRAEYDLARVALPRQRVVFVPGAVDPTPFRNANREAGRARLGLPPGRRAIVCVARLDRQKDQLLLVRAWAALGRAECDLVLAGPETSPGYADLCRHAAAGAAGRLVLTGNLDAAAIPDVLAAAEVAVLPSRHEPFGLAVLEAWAAGVPMVATQVGGPAWLLAEGDGELVPPGDAEALRAALVRLLDDPGRCAALAAKGLKRVQEFTWDRQWATVRALYDEAWAARGSVTSAR